MKRKVSSFVAHLMFAIILLVVFWLFCVVLWGFAGAII